MSESADMKRVGHPDFATVEFQLEHFPAPLRWDGSDNILSWGTLPDPQPSQMETWDSLLPILRQLIVREVGCHIPSGEAVDKGLKLHFMAYTGIPLSSLDLRPLRTLLPWHIIAREKLTITSMKVVKEYWSSLPKDALW